MRSATRTKEEKLQAFPPLSQSRQVAMGCESFYVARYVDLIPDIESEPARRGTEIHAVIAAYVKHLCTTNQATDYGFLRTLAHDASPDAREVLEKFCESFIFDPDKVLDTEWKISLDAEFSICKDGAHFEGTLDLVTMESESEATIWDWKSFFMVVDADTFQSKLYPLLLFSLNPFLEKIRFVLFFVRYGASREVTYTRADVPALQKLVLRERERQLEIHHRHDGGPAVIESKASPGRHCGWCPLLTDGCPLGKVNPYAKLTPDQRLMQTAWLKEAYAHSMEILKDFVVEGGPVECRDDNGSLLRADFRPKTIKSYPLGQALPILTEWTHGNPGDGYMVEGLTISGLSSPLKAKKRAALAEKMGAIADVRVQTELRVGAAKEEE